MEVLSKEETFQLGPEGEAGFREAVIGAESILGEGNSICKDPES